MRTIAACAMSIGVFSGIARLLFAHPGGLDSSGGHHDRKNGGYHYHGGGSSSAGSSTRNDTAAPSSSKLYLSDRTPRYESRTTARTLPRESAPPAPRTVASHDYSSMPHSPQQVKNLLEAKYRATFVNNTTKDIAGYDEIDDRYMFYLLGGGSIGYPKSVVTKIEPLSEVAAASAS